MPKNYYEILALKRGSSDEQIAQSYKKMVLRWHPKFAKQDQKTAYYHFSQISQAYEVLSDPIKKAFYDKYGWEKLKEGLFAEGQLKGGYRFANNPDEIYQKFFQSNHDFAKVFDKEIIERGSIFSHAFGGLKYKDQEQCQDLVVDVNCTLHELYKGVAKLTNYQRRVLNPCGRTTSLVEEQKLIEVKPGYSQNTVIRLVGQGHESVHRRKSNLIFRIKQIPHSNFTRSQNDLIYKTQIKLAQAIDSRLVELFSLDNRKIRVSIDEIVNPLTLKEVIGEGMPILNTAKYGNLYIKFDIIFPTNLPQHKKAQLRKLLS